jgi:hypothetical protein
MTITSVKGFAFAVAFGAMLFNEPPTPNFAGVNAALIRFSNASRDFIGKTFTPSKEEVAPVDTVAAANLDEDLDWRIASQAKNETALHAFLAKHPLGAHAPEAQMALDKNIAPPGSPSPPPPPTPVAVPLLTSPVVEVANAPPQPDVFARLEERAPPQSQAIIIKWKHERQRTVVQWRYARPRYYRQPPPPNLFQALFGPRTPQRWHVQR